MKRFFFALLLVLAAGTAVGESYSVLGELTPSTPLTFEGKAELSRAVMRELPLAELAALFELDGFQWSYGSGGYQREIAPNVVATVKAEERERVRAFALAWMYVYRQDAVPFFRAAQGGRPAVRLRFGRPLSPAAEAHMYAALVNALGNDAGYTRVGASEIVVLDLSAQPHFQRGMAAFATSMAAKAERFSAQAECASHDWRRDPRGAALLAALPRHAEASLRALRLRYDDLLRDYSAAETRLAVVEHD